MQITQPYEIANEFNITELLEHFDSNYIFDIINDKLDNMEFYSVLEEPNIIASFEENFKIMNDNYPGDSQNIQQIRNQVYIDIINILCNRFNLEPNYEDPNVNPYTLAYHLYDFLVCNRNNYMVNFFTSFIINNKDSLSRYLNLDDYKKSKDASASYSKRVYEDNEYGMIAANIPIIINHIATLDITLENIFQSLYTNYEVLDFLTNAIADKSNFFRDHYCAVLSKPDILPIFITNIRLALQRIVGDISQQNIQEFMLYGGEIKNG